MRAGIKLIHDAVGKGIGKGNPQFNEIGSCIDEGGDEAGGSGEIGITGYEVGDKGFALLFLRRAKRSSILWGSSS